MIASQKISIFEKKIHFEMEKFFESITSDGRVLINERLWAIEKFKNDPKIIKCTFIPGQGWDLTESEARHFIDLINGVVKTVNYQPRLDIIMHESDAHDYIWIVFE